MNKKKPLVEEPKAQTIRWLTRLVEISDQIENSQGEVRIDHLQHAIGYISSAKTLLAEITGKGI